VALSDELDGEARSDSTTANDDDVHGHIEHCRGGEHNSRAPELPKWRKSCANWCDAQP
jgi:hypothetical protein